MVNKHVAFLSGLTEFVMVEVHDMVAHYEGPENILKETGRGSPEFRSRTHNPMMARNPKAPSRLA